VGLCPRTNPFGHNYFLIFYLVYFLVYFPKWFTIGYYWIYLTIYGWFMVSIASRPLSKGNMSITSWIVMVFTKVMYPCVLQGEDPPVMLVYDLHKYYRVLRGL
jgi:hypothetical protein